MKKRLIISGRVGAVIAITSIGAAVLPVAPAIAAERPDAGQTLQQLQQTPPTLPKESPSVVPEPAPSSSVAPGGPQVTVQAIAITGNSIFDEATLQGVVADARGDSFDLAGLKGLADRISDFYHAHDYPFARAFIPEQSMGNGTLTIAIVEGRYGDVKILDGDARADEAKEFLSNLGRGDVIKGEDLERTSLILDDQPGYKFVPIIRPGQEVGTGDLVYRMNRDQPYGGTARIDNHGNRYTGRMRGQLGLFANSPFTLGDQINTSLFYTEENMWSGSLGYSIPLGYSGLRGNVGYAKTYYELGQEFSSLDAHGTAQVASAGLSYPIVRSQVSNLTVAATYQHKWLTDEQGAAGTVDKKTSQSLPIALNFDARDQLMGNGLTYGAVSWTHGILDLDDGLLSSDRTSARSNGNFDKFNLDVARLQSLPVDSLTLYARASGQVSTDNLDSSEDFGLGGPDGVRAYPEGESYGDEGALGQVELRYALDLFSPYVFYDYGYIRTNEDPWTSGVNRRDIGGGGLGLRFAYKDLSAEASAAWRDIGGDPQSDSSRHVPVLWFTTAYKF